MMEITKESFWDTYEKKESNIKKIIKTNKIITVLLIGLISFTGINIMLIYSFIRNMQML